MNEIEINWLQHDHLCGNCEGSTGYGAAVKVGGELILSLIPEASCNSVITYTPEAVYVAIINHLGYNVTAKKL